MLTSLDILLSFCKRNSVTIVGIIPPFADGVNEKLKNSKSYNYLKEINPPSLSVFDKYNFKLYDFTFPNSFGSNDGEMIDGFHGGELTYGKMLIKMLEAKLVLDKTSSLPKLKNNLKHSWNNFLVYK